MEEINYMNKNTDKKSTENKQIQLLNENLEEQNLLNTYLNDELTKVKNDNELLTQKIINYEKKIKDEENKQKDENNEMNKKLENIKNENLILKSSNEKLTNELIYNKNHNTSEELKRQTQELEELKQILFKNQTERENETKSLKKENEILKKQLIDISKSIPKKYNDLLNEYNDLELKCKNNLKKNVKEPKNEGEPGEESTGDNLSDITNTKKELEIMKLKSQYLVDELKDRDTKNEISENKSEQNVPLYEEEFDLRKIAIGARKKDKSEDIKIDYIGIQEEKEKYKELEFFYASLKALVKKLLMSIQCNSKNKNYITELCRIVGFDKETTNKILNNKNKGFLSGLFNK